METSQKLIGIAEACTVLGVHINTLRRWDKAGHLRSVRMPGGHRRYRIVDIEAFQQKDSGQRLQPEGK